MGIGHPWAGRFYGTNTGNLSVRLYGPDEKLTGVLRINDTEYGVSSYQIEGSFVDSKLVLSGKRAKGSEDGIIYGDLSVVGELNPNGELVGEWETTIGSGGTFRLYLRNQE